MRDEIVVIGSINQDLIIKTPRMPILGETVTGEGFAVAAGGKGANQAAAAARLCGRRSRVSLIAAVGGDDSGRLMIDGLLSSGVDVSRVRTIADAPTGTAVILICGGDNCIILDRGANQYLTPDLIGGAGDIITNAGLMLLQLEIPFKTVEYAVTLAKRHGVPVMLNPAPAADLTDDFLKYIDILTPNASECEILTGQRIDGVESAKKAVSVLNQRGVKQVIVTLGGLGAVFNDGETILRQPAFEIKDITDTTAAGDCFIGAAAVKLIEGADIQRAVRFAAAAAAVSVTRLGAQPSLPRRAEVDELLHKHSLRQT